MEWVAINLSWLTVSGLLWDLAAAFYLGQAFLTSDEDLKLQAGTYWGLSVPLLKSLCKQRYDAKFGVWHLAVGFLLQLLASIGLTTGFGLAAVFSVPILLAVIHYNWRLSAEVCVNVLRIGTRGRSAEEDIWRKYFPEISEPQWTAAVKRSGARFKKEDTPADGK